MNPMFLAYKPPQMLPTQTLNPTPSQTGAAATSTSGSKIRRGLDDHAAPLPMNHRVIRTGKPIDADKWWWVGVGMTALGGVGYFCF